MSDRGLLVSRSEVALLLAVHLGREDAGQFLPATRIVRDVGALLTAARGVKQALGGGRSPDRAYEAAVKVAEVYRARVVRQGEVEGVSLGLCFWGVRCGEPGAVFKVI